MIIKDHNTRKTPAIANSLSPPTSSPPPTHTLQETAAPFEGLGTSRLSVGQLVIEGQDLLWVLY